MKLILTLCLLASLSGCYTVWELEDQEWKEWPRRGSTPLASDDCMTDACLEHREYILAHKFEEEVEK